MCELVEHRLGYAGCRPGAVAEGNALGARTHGVAELHNRPIASGCAADAQAVWNGGLTGAKANEAGGAGNAVDTQTVDGVCDGAAA
jgi:hypothetical protein